jgi:hypothetical protein
VPDTHEDEAAPADGEAEGAVTEPTGPPEPAEPLVPEPDPSMRTDAIMSKLPHTRPQRVTGRRHREQARQAPRPSRAAPGASQEASPTRSAKRTPAQRSAAARPKPRAGTAAAVPVTQAPTSRDPARRRGEAGNAPGLPRLAVDGAIEAAKLPLRVGGRLTLRALDAAARSLRGR